MGAYRFQGRTKDGQLISGEALGNSVGDVAEQMQNRGIILIKMEPVQEAADEAASLFDKAPNSDDIVLFSRQMQTLVRAGVPIVRALRGVRDGILNKMFRQALTTIITRIEAGMEFSEAMQEHPKVFTRLYYSMVAIGEKTGRLEEAFGQLFRYIEVDRDTSRRIKSAMRYPIFVLSAMFIAMFCISFFVIPTFIEFFATFSLDLPWQTKVLINTSKFTLKYWYLIILGIIGVVGAFIYYTHTKQGDLWWSEYKFKIPVIGDIIKRGIISRFCRAFSMSSRSGVPVLDTLASLSVVIDNSFVASKTRQMIDSIQNGESLIQAAHATGLFPPLVMQMMSVGDETGQMDRMMEDIAIFYEQELEYDIKKLTSLIEPVITLMLGGMVFILAVGVFLPMWNLVQLAGKH
ncbi:MAG: type II secretion system F family protein [Magnetococcus sp. YQC-5]